MKYLLSLAAAAFAFASLATPAAAFSTGSPAITIVPLSSAHVAIVGAVPGCDAPAAVEGTPVFQLPTIAEELGISGKSVVKIDLTSAGKLAAEQLYEASGNQWLDGAALQSARMTQFTSETVSCEHVAGSYLYAVEF